MAARWVLIVCALVVAGEVVLWATTVDRSVALQPAGFLLVAFLIGPPAFLALLAWRRRTHPVWPRRFLALAVVLAVVGLGVLGWDCYRFRTDPEFRKTVNMNAVLVPLGQWAAVLAVWLVVVIREAREKRRTS